jgi:N-terminal EH-domain containing protein
MKRATSSKNKQMSGATQGEMDETADRTQQIADRLKDIYANSVHPVEKRYRYDYFFESPYLTNVEFDGTSTSKKTLALLYSFYVSYTPS